MKKFLSILVVSALILNVSAQMHVKKFNFSSFNPGKKLVTKAMSDASSPEAKQHPEYGILPFNAQCSECVELIDKRTEKTREFLDNKKGRHFFTQQSYFPLSYKKSENDIWHTIDYRIHPDERTSNVYIADQQPVPTKLDLNKKNTSLNIDGFEFEFNNNVTLYFFDENTVYTHPEIGNYADREVGDEGLLVKNFWDGINLETTFRPGQVETNYVINAPLQLPMDKGWMVIEDHFSLPDGYTVNEIPGGERSPEGYYKADYEIKDPIGRLVAIYGKPVYVDAKAWGMHGNYKLLKNGNNYTLQMYIPVEWLNKKENTYPLFIDPPVIGVTKNGDFSTSTTQHYNGFAFSTQPKSCDYHMTAYLPGKSTITNAYVDLEYKLTYDNTCGHPPLPSPYCQFNMVIMNVTNDACGTNFGPLSCNPALPPFTGTCTTDPQLVNGAHRILINTPGYLSCIAPQCPDYGIPFTLKDQDTKCDDSCGYLCATGQMWQMTLEGCLVDGTISVDKDHVCAGQPVTYTAHPNCGVAPYHYRWFYPNSTGGTDSVDISNSPDFVTHPQVTQYVYCHIYDICNGTPAMPDPIQVFVGNAPPADAGPDVHLCAGGVANLGGAPTTTDPNPTIQWTGSSPAAESWLNSKTSQNPKATIPKDTVGNFFYVVTVTNPSCFRQDTVFVTSTPNPTPIIDSSGPLTFCAGGSVTLSTQGSYPTYAWSNGASTNSITVNQSGSFKVTVTDVVTCSGVSNTLVVTVIPAPPADAGPDQVICEGGLITIGGNPTTDSTRATATWTGSDPTVESWLNNPGLYNPQVTVPAGMVKDFFYVVTATDPNCFRTDTVVIKSVANPVPVIDSSGPTKLCVGRTVNLSVNGAYPIYVWSDSSTTRNITVDASGQYQVTVTDLNGCTGTSNVIPVTIYDIKPFRVYPDTSILYGDNVTLYSDADLGLASADSFTWYPDIDISCLKCANPVANPLNDQYYGLTVYSGGCLLSDSALIRIIYPNNFFIPNGFTPNGNGTNDNFYIQMQTGVHVLLFQVFNRWGEKMHDGATPWDGNYLGKPAPAGVYTYLFKLSLFGDQRPLFRKGTVTLLR